MKRIKLIVKGDVVGVRFREYAQKKALAEGLKGYVKNQPDRTVEIICEGPPQKMDDFIKDIKNAKKGNKDHPLIDVKEVEIKEDKSTDKFASFEIKYGGLPEEIADQMGAAYGVLLGYDTKLGKLDEKYGVISQNISESSGAIKTLASAITSFQQTLIEDRVVIKELGRDIRDLMKDFREKK